MQLAEISIRRPVFSTVFSLLIVLIGAVSFNRLTVCEFPKIDEPVVTVSVRYAGAFAEVIESQVTKPLEVSITGIDGVGVITSISRDDQKQISMRFRHEKDADSAAAKVRDRNDAMVSLSALVNVRESVSPREQNHFGQRRSVSILASLAADYPLGEAIKFMDRTAAKVLKTGYCTDRSGTSREFRNSQGALAFVFLLALMFILLVLAAQFESSVDPLVIMLSVPLSMICALLALKWSSGSLNVYS